MMRQPVLGVGWDVGGWIGRKQAVAIAEWNDHSAQWRGAPIRFSIVQLGEHWGVDDLVRCAWPEAPSEILETRKLIIAIDAPFGFPVAFNELLAGRSTPSFDPSGPEIENPLAYRETDRHIYRTFGKKPLSGSFDKLGNNATVAMVHTRRLSTAGQLRVAPFDEPQIGIPTAIEVYPALMKRKKGVVTLSQTERNLPTTANVDARNFKDLACWLIVQIGPISLNVTTPRKAVAAV